MHCDAGTPPMEYSSNAARKSSSFPCPYSPKNSTLAFLFPSPDTLKTPYFDRWSVMITAVEESESYMNATGSHFIVSSFRYAAPGISPSEISIGIASWITPSTLDIPSSLKSYTSRLISPSSSSVGAFCTS